MRELSYYSEDYFNDIERKYYDHQLLTGENFAIVVASHPTWWKQTFDFSRYVKKNQLQKITLTSIKTTFKELFNSTDGTNSESI